MVYKISSINLRSLFVYYRVLLTIVLSLECLYFSFFVVTTPFAVDFNMAGFAWCFIGSSGTALPIYLLWTKRVHVYGRLFRTIFTWLVIAGALMTIGFIGFVAMSSWLAGELTEWLGGGVAGYVELNLATSMALLVLGFGLHKNRPWAQMISRIALLTVFPFITLLLPFTGMTSDRSGAVSGIAVTGTLGIVLCLSLRGFLE